MSGFNFDLCINVVISNLVVLGLNLLRASCSEILILLPFIWGGGVLGFHISIYFCKVTDFMRLGSSD